MKIPNLIDIATRSIVFIDINSSLQEATTLLADKNIRHLIIRDTYKYFYIEVSDIIKFKVDGILVDTLLKDLNLKVLKIVDEKKSIIDASFLINEENTILGIGSLEYLKGIVTISDLLNLQLDSCFKNMKLSSILNTNVVETLDYTKLVKESLLYFDRSHNDSLIIEKNKKPIGIITKRDIVKMFAKDENLDKKVSEFMSSPLFSVSEGLNASEALKILQEKHFKRLVVIDKNGDLKGIITQQDLLSAIYSNLVRNNYINLEEVNKILEKKIDEKNKKIFYDFYHDNLTKLPNKNKLLEDMDFFDRNRCLLHLNINRFKELNNFYGYVIGDKILIETSNTLKNIIKNNIVYKLFADEFIIVCKEHQAENIIKQLEFLEIEVENHHFIISFSIGVIHYDNSISKEDVLNRADIALKYAQINNKSVIFYNDDINLLDDFKQNIDCVKRIKSAIEDDRIVLYFQPIYDKQEQIAKFESLIRLRDENGEDIPPFRFLDVAKKSRLYTKLTKIVIEKAFQTFTKYDYTITVNINIEDLNEIDFIDYVISKVQEYNMQGKVIFEILESEEIRNYEVLLNFTKRVEYLDVFIAIDDFGSGYSNFSHLINLDVKVLKLDGSLIKRITEEKVFLLIKSILIASRALNIESVAEFVENREIKNRLDKLDIDCYQGYYFSKPISFENIDTFICNLK
jgi:diguanylate cyclase (GGDEF)-like protein